MKKKILLVVLFMGILSAGIAQNLNPVLAKMGDDEWQSAYDDLEVIMKKKKKNLDAKFYAAICLTQLYRPDEAIALFKLSADLGQDVPMYYVFFAEAYIRAEEIQNAKNIFGRVTRDNIEEPDLPQYRRVQANIRAGEKYLPNPKDIIVQNLGPNINTAEGEYSPVMTSDHRSVFFTARRKSESQKSEDGTAYEQVMTTAMDDFDDWEKDAKAVGRARPSVLLARHGREERLLKLLQPRGAGRHPFGEQGLGVHALHRRLEAAFDPAHDGLVGATDVGKAHELPRLLGRAVDLDLHFHPKTPCQSAPITRAARGHRARGPVSAGEVKLPWPGAQSLLAHPVTPTLGPAR